MTPCCADEAGDSVRQRNIVVVQEDDELPTRRGEAEIARPGYAQAETSHDTKLRIETNGGGVELVTIVNNDQLDVLVCLGTQGG